MRALTRSAAALLALLLLWSLAAPADASWASSATGAAPAQSASLAPPTPANSLVATCGLLRASVKLDWAASPSAWTDGYEVRWGTSSGSYTSSGTTGPGVLTFTNPTSLPTGIYYFAVRATTGQWRSSDTNEVSKLIVLASPLPPVCL